MRPQPPSLAPDDLHPPFLVRKPCPRLVGRQADSRLAEGYESFEKDERAGKLSEAAARFHVAVLDVAVLEANPSRADYRKQLAVKALTAIARNEGVARPTRLTAISGLRREAAGDNSKVLEEIAKDKDRPSDDASRVRPLPARAMRGTSGRLLGLRPACRAQGRSFRQVLGTVRFTRDRTSSSTPGIST